VVTKPFGNSVPPSTPGAPSLNHLRVLGIASCASGFAAESPSTVSARWSSVTISSTLGSGWHSLAAELVAIAGGVEDEEMNESSR
jgi:hypothetical protein